MSKLCTRKLEILVLSEVCNDVEVELHLQPLYDESFQKKTDNAKDRACLDIAMNAWLLGRPS